MNNKQRKTIEIIRRKHSRLNKIRSESVYMLNFGRIVMYEIEVGTSRILNQHTFIYEIGPKGGMRKATKVYQMIR